ncbi:hypothetical protein ABZP36_034139 [Zizania latifolia]
MTAYGHKEKHFAGGTVIHNCIIEPHPEFNVDDGKFRTFVSQPWKYFHMLYIQSDIGDFINLQGWLS